MQKVERFVVIFLLLFATGFGEAFLAERASAGESGGQPIAQITFGTIYLIIAILLVRYRTFALEIVKREKWTALVCLWAIASTFWSVEPAESFRRGLAITGTSLAGLYIGMRFDPKEQLRMMSFVLGLGAVFSLALILFMPSVATDPEVGWQGVYFLKNSLGRMMALGTLCFGLLALSEKRHRTMRGLMFVLCCVLLVLSKSATAVVVTMLMVAMFPLRKLLYLRPKHMVAALAVTVPVVVAAVIWVVEYSDEILTGLGRTSSLTGRIPLWQLVIKEIAVHPIRGYGFTAFWNSWEGQRVSDTVAWDAAVPHAHNGFLELWLGLGIIGLGILMINVARNFVLALRVTREHREIEQAWPLLLLVFTVLYNLTETSLLGVNSMPWMAYGAVTFWLARNSLEEQHVTEPVEEINVETEPVYLS